MIYPRLKQITALFEESYELIFDDSGADIRIIGGIDLGRISVVPWEPDLFWTGKLGDPRPIAAAVMAFHHARYQDLTTYRA